MNDCERIEFLVDRLQVERGDPSSPIGVFWLPPSEWGQGHGHIGTQRADSLSGDALWLPVYSASWPVLDLLEALEGCVLHEGQSFTRVLNQIPTNPSLARELVNLVLKGALRDWLLPQPGYRLGQLCGNFEPGLRAALERIHQAPSLHHGLGDLAELAHMCRSGFANRFREVVGVPPLQYVRLLRLDLAERMMEQEAYPLQVVAEQVGYSCAKCLSKAFSRKVPLESRKPDSSSRKQGGVRLRRKAT